MALRYAKIPAHFRHEAQSDNQSMSLFPLLFNISPEGEERFFIGSKEIAPSDLRPRRFDINTEGVEPISYFDMPEYPLLASNTGVIISGPLFRDFLERKKNVKKASQIITELGMELLVYVRHGFSIRIEGTPAVIELASNSQYVRGRVEKGYSELIMNGDSSRQQRTSLLAGVGYIACLATN